jgi:hypothetical protein
MELTGCYTYKFRISLPTPAHLGIVPRNAGTAADGPGPQCDSSDTELHVNLCLSLLRLIAALEKVVTLPDERRTSHAPRPGARLSWSGLVSAAVSRSRSGTQVPRLK